VLQKSTKEAPCTILRFDMRAPAMGARTVDLYAAVPEMCAWAENHGGLAAVVCEHHGAEDGYLPSPLLLASAIAARTERLALSLILLLPFTTRSACRGHGGPRHHQQGEGFLHSRARISAGGVSNTSVWTCAHVAVSLTRSWPCWRELLSGEAVFEGRRINTTPPPHTVGGPMLMWGGGTVAAARRAGRYGWACLETRMCLACKRLTRLRAASTGTSRGPCFFPTATPRLCASLPMTLTMRGTKSASYLLHDVQAYAAWNPDNATSAGFSMWTPSTNCARWGNRTASTAWPKPSNACARERSSTFRRCGGGVPRISRVLLKRIGEVVIPEAAK